MLLSLSSYLTFAIALKEIRPNNSFSITQITNNNILPSTNAIKYRSIQCQASQLNDMDFKVNGETKSSNIEKIEQQEPSSSSIHNKSESIGQEAISQYEQAMEYFMFELGNDIVFLSDANEVSTYIERNFDTLIFDCDGVLYRGGNIPIPDSVDAIKYMMNHQKKILFLTNNAEYSREQLRDKLNGILGFEELGIEQMITSSYSTAKYLQRSLCYSSSSGEKGDKKRNEDDCNIFVVGSKGLCDEIEKFGFNVNSSSSSILSSNSKEENSSSSSMDRIDLASYTFALEEKFDNNNPKIDAIVVGLDTDFTYRKLCIVTSLLQRHPNALFIATNEDSFDIVDGNNNIFVKSDKRNLPGNGSIVKSIEVSSQKKAINVGKPSKVLVDLLQSEYQLDVGRTLMVGDRLDTDVKFGKDGGMKSALVLTGCTNVEKLMDVGVGTEDEPLPHIIIPHMGMMKGIE